jgi:hypothetical protein
MRSTDKRGSSNSKKLYGKIDSQVVPIRPSSTNKYIKNATIESNKSDTFPSNFYGANKETKLTYSAQFINRKDQKYLSNKKSPTSESNSGK